MKDFGHLNSVAFFHFLPPGKNFSKKHVQKPFPISGIYYMWCLQFMHLHKASQIQRSIDTIFATASLALEFASLSACFFFSLFQWSARNLAHICLEQIWLHRKQIPSPPSYLSIYSLRSSLAWTNFDSKLRYTSRSRSTLNLLTFSSFESCYS